MTIKINVWKREKLWKKTEEKNDGDKWEIYFTHNLRQGGSSSGCVGHCKNIQQLYLKEHMYYKCWSHECGYFWLIYKPYFLKSLREIF